MGRILVFTGKGGVGKTSVAAAHALHSAKEGKRTLLVSTDMAHNLSDLFEQSLGREEKEVVKNLFALEIDPSYLLEHEFVHLKNSLFQMLHSSKTFNAKPDELFTFPGMDELLSLIVIMDRYKQGNYERIIVDCAPTGETLSLLKFPELLSWYMEKWFPVGKVAVRMLAPISKHFFKVVLPDRKAMTEIERIYIKLMELQELLKDPFITSIRLVANPEKMVVEETKRNYMYMNLFGFHVDGLYINRILPRELENPFFENWIQIQKNYMEELEQVFSVLPRFYIPWFECDLNGLAGIERIDETVLQGEDLFCIREIRGKEEYEKTEEGYLLTLFLPCVEKEELFLQESETDIILKIGNMKRNIPRPSTLRSYEICSAKLEEGYLKILFVKREDEDGC